MKPKDELSHNTEVATCATDSPEQVRVLLGTSSQDLSASCHYGGLRAGEAVNGGMSPETYLHEIIQSKPVFASQETVSSTKEKANINAINSVRSGQAMKYTPSDTSLRVGVRQ
jgi:hypothetical protein